MILRYDGHENINADKHAVWAFINNPQKVGSCIPNTDRIEVIDNQSFIAHVNVGIGPVRGKFKVNVDMEPQADANKMMLRLRGGGLGTAVDLEASADLAEANGQTNLNWNGEALVRGPAAAIGSSVLDRKARELITYVFAEVKRKVSEEQVLA